jgi:hypothetical protein
MDRIGQLWGYPGVLWFIISSQKMSDALWVYHIMKFKDGEMPYRDRIQESLYGGILENWGYVKRIA